MGTIDLINQFLYLVPGSKEWTTDVGPRLYSDTYYREPVSGLIYKYRVGYGWCPVAVTSGLPALPGHLFQGDLFDDYLS